MKTTLFFGALWLALAGFFIPETDSYLKGKITSMEGEPLSAAAIKILKNNEFVKGTITDINGEYKVALDPGIYEIQISYTGFSTLKYVDVVVQKGATHILDASMEDGALTAVEIVSYKVPVIENDKSIGAQTLRSPDHRVLPPASGGKVRATTTARESKPEAGKAMGAAPVTPAVYAPSSGEAKPMAPGDGDAVALKGARKDRYPTDGILAKRKAPSKGEPAEPKVEAEEIRAYDELADSKEPVASGTISQPSPRAGLLTAGEWNDLHNWNKHWLDLLNDGEITSHEEMYGFFAHNRFTVFLTNELGFPLVDVVVQLKNEGEMIWEARSDNNGKAELWAGLFDKKSYSDLSAEAWVNGNKHRINNLKSAKEGYNSMKIKAECYSPANVDIVWAVDATGSMGDEIEYLKTELLDVINRAKNNNPALSFRMGAAFYRDKGDEYIVKNSALSAEISSTVDFIQHQFAGGGGDYPEAVHTALEEVIYNQKWSASAVARICFLVLDASPHQNPEVKASIQKSIKEAAKKGIRIVPLAASGIQKDTEFLMKFFGLATNGSYLFLTDHSGIGGKHLEPTSDEYKVEPLNDLLVRIITEYTSVKTCEGKSNIRFEDDPQQQPGQVLQASYYPNPASDKFTIELPIEVQSITLYDSEGKGVRKIEKPLAGPNVMQVHDLPPGYYTIRIANNGKMQSGKLMVVR
jgi:hypothetical protein